MGDEKKRELLDEAKEKKNGIEGAKTAADQMY